MEQSHLYDSKVSLIILPHRVAHSLAYMPASVAFFAFLPHTPSHSRFEVFSTGNFREGGTVPISLLRSDEGEKFAIDNFI